MIGLFLFLIVVVGVLGLVGGLQHFGVLQRRDAVPGQGPTREDLHRLQDLLGGLEARLDRLEDQQRFLERLLESRPERPSLPPGPAPEPEREGGVERGVDSVLFDVERGEAGEGG